MAKKTSKKAAAKKAEIPQTAPPRFPLPQEEVIPETSPIICKEAEPSVDCQSDPTPPPYTGIGTAVAQNYPNTTPVVCAGTIPTVACHGHATYPNTSPIVYAGTTAYYQAGVYTAVNYPNTTPVICARTIPTLACHGHATYPNTSPLICAGTQRTIPQVSPIGIHPTGYQIAAAYYYHQVQQAQVIALARAQALAQAQAIATTMPFCPTVLCDQTIASGLEDSERVEEKVKPKPTVTKKVSKPSATKKPKKVSKPKKSQKDDLKVVEGIGPKIEQLLNKAGVHTWSELGAARIAFLRGVLADAGKRYAIHDPKTWARQAKLAAAGNWDKLKAWQDELKGGK